MAGECMGYLPTRQRRSLVSSFSDIIENEYPAVTGYLLNRIVELEEEIKALREENKRLGA